MRKKQIILFFISMSVLISCQSFYKSEPPVEIDIQKVVGGQWEAKAMIKNRVSGEAHVVNLDVLAKKPQNMRMEVTTSLGAALASIAMKENNIECLLPKQKKFFYGPVSEKSIYAALKIKVDPRILSAAFFETSYPEWDCQADDGFISFCKTPEGVELEWEREEEQSKRIVILGQDFEVQIQIKKFIERSDFPETVWKVKVPSGFKQIKL